jgi:hypothetical protein
MQEKKTAEPIAFVPDLHLLKTLFSCEIVTGYKPLNSKTNCCRLSNGRETTWISLETSTNCIGSMGHSGDATAYGFLMTSL